MVEKIHKAKGLESEFVILRNKDVQRKDLSYEAIGMLVHLMSLSPEWDIYVEQLQRPGAGRDKVRRMLNELQTNGYIYVEQHHTPDGKFTPNEYHAYAMPEYNPHYKSDNQPLTEKPSTAKPQTVEPSTANPPLESKYSNKANKIEEKESPLNPPNGESEAIKDDDIPSSALNDMKQAVKKHLKQYNPRQQENVAKILLGVVKGKNADFNISKPITPYMLDVFVTWWDANHKKNGIPLTRPKNMDSVKQWIETWLEETYKPDNKSFALNGSKPVEGRYVDKSGVTPVTDDYRHQYGLPDVTESDVPSFLLDETKG